MQQELNCEQEPLNRVSPQLVGGVPYCVTESDRIDERGALTGAGNNNDEKQTHSRHCFDLSDLYFG